MAFRVSLRQCSKIFKKNSLNERHSIVRLYATRDRDTPDSNEAKDEQVIFSTPNRPEVKDLEKAIVGQALPETLITVSTIEDVGIVSGTPEEHIKKRLVRIYQPPKNAMQSGTNNINYWQIDFDTRERWENPLMGWTSSGDPLSNLQVNFSNVEAAIQHCEKMGWKYYIQKPNVVNPKPRTYGSNFAWNKRTRVSTK